MDEACSNNEDWWTVFFALAPLGSDWAEHYSKTYQRFYWFNCKTGAKSWVDRNGWQEQWLPPLQPRVEAEYVAMFMNDKTCLPLRTELDAIGNQNSPTSTRVLPGWSLQYSERYQRHYWFNGQTNESSWVKK